LNPLALGFSPIFTIQNTHICLAAIAVSMVDGNKCFFNYFTVGLKGAADHPQLRQARSVSGNAKRPNSL